MGFNSVINFVLSDKESNYNIWLDRKSGMIVKMECTYITEGGEKYGNSVFYRYQLNNITDDIVVKPDLEGYSIVEL